MESSKMDEPRLFLGGRVALHAGDCLDVLRGLPDNSIDAINTDPPYALTSITDRFGAEGAAPAQFGTDGAFARASRGFMGKKWDTGERAFSVEFWRECLRVLKPGGHLVAFSGTRTYHRMAVAIEDAGFDIRDQLAWAYGTGFPKSHNVGRAIDRKAGVERQIIRANPNRRAVSGVSYEGVYAGGNTGAASITAPATDEAAQWEGWGTALKPAWEPICLARKPVEGTVAENCLKWGTGALNVGGCRIGTDSVSTQIRALDAIHGGALGDPAVAAARRGLETTISDPRVGRYPANIVHDGSAEVASCFPMADEVSASRFFYSAKADGDDRHGLNHPTIKPVDLMRWLARLTCRKGGTILDPFAGTGTTAEAAYWEGCNAVLVEREEEYQAAIAIRMGLVLAGPDEKKRARTKLAAAEGLPLFGGVEAESAPYARGVLGAFADDALTAQERGKAATARKARARANDKSQSDAA
jgi:site-specific DNA-methyltransferase (adenine-specific)